MNPKYLPLVLVVLFAPAVFGQDYEVRIGRALKAGDALKLSVTAKQTQDQSITLNGAPQKDDKQSVSVQFDGVEKVIAVDSNGKETKITLTVDKFTQTEGDKTSDLLPKGAVVTCSIGDDKKQAYEIDGKAADDAATQALDMIVDLSRGGPTDDEALGTKEKKKKGDSWDVNADQTKKYLEGAGDFTNITGKTTLDDVTGGNMKLSAHITATFKPPLPDTITVDSATMEANVSETCPIDTSKYESEDATSLITSFSGHADSPNGKVVMKLTMAQTSSRTITPVK